jgi:hypothetical protein
MNRATRRAHKRQLVAVLRAAGCRCSAHISPDEVPDTSVPGARWTGRVRHHVGCPLGDTVLGANLAGRLPVLLFGDDGTGCDR